MEITPTTIKLKLPTKVIFDGFKLDIEYKLREKIDQSRAVDILINSFKDRASLNNKVERLEEKLHALQNEYDRVEALSSSSTSKKTWEEYTDEEKEKYRSLTRPEIQELKDTESKSKAKSEESQ